MEFIHALIGLLGEYSPLLAFIGGMINEEVLLFLAILSGSGAFDFWVVFVFGYLAVIIHDAAFYFIGRSAPVYYLKRKLSLAKRKNKFARFIEKLAEKNMFLPLLLSKFVYGIRILTIIYLSHKERKFWRYFGYNSLAVLIWFCIMLPLGWLAGRGFTELLHVAKGVEKILAVVFIGIIILYLVNRFIISLFRKKRKN